jgi:hypothetical protein
MARMTERLADALQFLPELTRAATGWGDAGELRDAVAILGRLIDQGESAEPEALARCAVEERGWSPAAAERLAFVWQVVLCQRELEFRRRLASAGLRAGEGWASLSQAAVSLNYEWLDAQAEAAARPLPRGGRRQRRRTAPWIRRRLRYPDRMKPPWEEQP